MKVKGFKLFVAAVFLNAFIDIGHKITVQNTLFKIYDSSEQVFHTAIVNSLILWPYIFLFSFSAYLSDRHPRHTVMRVTSLSSILITALITCSYWLGEFWWAYALTLVMAAQSAIYGPAKYAYIRDLLGRANVAHGNGIAHSLTLMSILLATVLFSAVFEHFYLSTATTPEQIIQLMVPAGFVLITLAIIEAWFIWQLPAKTKPNTLHFNWSHWFSFKTFRQNIEPIKAQPMLWGAILGLTTFWCVGQIALAAWPAHMKMVTGQTNTLWVQAVMGASVIGIGLGAYLGGRVSKNYIEWGGVAPAVVIASFMVWLLPFLTSEWAMTLAFLAFGFAGGLFIVPLNSLIQFNSKDHEIGKALAANNWVQNVAMVACLMLTATVSYIELEPIYVLIFSAALMTVMGGLTLRRFGSVWARWRGKRYTRAKLKVEGLDHLPHGPVILSTNEKNSFTWVQMATPRKVKYAYSKDRAQEYLAKGYAVVFNDGELNDVPHLKVDINLDEYPVTRITYNLE